MPVLTTLGQDLCISCSLLRQQTYLRTSIVRARDMGFSGWRFGCIVADDTNPKRFLMENRFGFDWLMIHFLDDLFQ